MFLGAACSGTAPTNPFVGAASVLSRPYKCSSVYKQEGAGGFVLSKSWALTLSLTSAGCQNSAPPLPPPPCPTSATFVPYLRHALPPPVLLQPPVCLPTLRARRRLCTRRVIGFPPVTSTTTAMPYFPRSTSNLRSTFVP
jgi:hypothetical protein